MTVASIMDILEPVGIAAIIVVIGSLIKIKPLELNLWGFLACKLGCALNYEMMKQIHSILDKQKEMEDKLDNHITEDEENKAREKRQLILSFGKEILKGEKHTREGFVEILAIIDDYEKYCEEHPKFPNNRAIFAINLIKDNYKERLEKADFLEESYRRYSAKRTENK